MTTGRRLNAGSVFPTLDRDVPFVTTEQMREVDRAMVEDYRVSLVQMMENAGRALAHLARHRFLQGDPRGRKVLVLAGTGGNGGGGLVCARRLDDWGAAVSVWTPRSASWLSEATALQLGILDEMKVPIETEPSVTELPPADLVVDAIIGYSLSGPPGGAAAALIQSANAHIAPVLSLDIPSGVDAASGDVHEPAVRAAATVTLALPKAGMRTPESRELVGGPYLADIGVPPDLYARPPLGLDVGPIFAKGDILRVW